jgi:hypothetical protein
MKQSRINNDTAARLLVAGLLACWPMGLTAPTFGRLVGYWPFDGDFLDTSGFQNNGSIIGSGVGFSSGLFGSALSLNGNGWINVPHSNSLNLSTAMTLAAWINPTHIPDDNSGVIFKGQIDYSHGPYDLGFEFPSTPSLFGSINNETVFAEGQNTISYGSWQHIAATFDGLVLRVFKDGVQISSKQFSGTISQEVSPLSIGNRYQPISGVFGRNTFAGAIDEIRIYDTALNPSDILGLIDGGDFNNDSAVDAGDYAKWRDGLVTTFTQTDYNTWRANFGRSDAAFAGATAGLPSSSNPVVPEPSAMSLLLFAIAGYCRTTARRNSSKKAGKSR